MKRVRFDVDHMCGETHTVTAWTTATPGLVVWNDGPNNVPCADEDYGWCISQPNRTSVEQVEPLAESPWRASCSRCGWYQDEHYPEDAEGEADAHECPACAVCGHQEPARAPGEHTAP